MEKFVIKIGSISVEVQHRYDYIKKLCNEYITDSEADFSVSAAEEAIQAETELVEQTLPISVCEGTCIHREVVNGLVKYGYILIHSAVIAVDGLAYVFTAKSGVGKSTHIRLWKKAFGNRAVIVNGDKPMFSFNGDTLMVHGTPWKGKEGQGENISLPVKAICFLERGEVNEVSKATSNDIINKLFHQVLLPDNVQDADVFLNTIDRIAKTVPFYNLKCNMEWQAAIISYNEINK